MRKIFENRKTQVVTYIAEKTKNSKSRSGQL